MKQDDQTIIDFIQNNPKATYRDVQKMFRIGGYKASRLFKQAKQAGGERFDVTGSDNSKEIVSVSKSIRTLDEALAEGKVDLKTWEVERYIINKWEVFAKDYGHQPLWQVKVWLKRRLKKRVTDAFEIVMKEMDKHSPKYAPKKILHPTDPHLLELSIFDLHLGKLAWSSETGVDYDVKIAREIYHDAIEDLASKAKGFPIDRILMPIGQDFFHLDNVENKTVNGTPLDVDSRYPKIFGIGVLACVQAIDYMLGIAPVDVIWVPGNHDRTTSYHLVRELEAWYRNCKNVNVDCSPKIRKYYSYGKTLIGFTHGNEENGNTLPSIMASECPRGWCSSVTREWHIGHKHKNNVKEFEVDGVPVGVRVLPSLSGTDSWHYRKGFANQLRAASAFVYSKNRGFSGYFLSMAKDYKP